jgi:hypothetical protein
LSRTGEGFGDGNDLLFRRGNQDKKEPDGRMHLEFGRSSFYGGESLVYLTVDDKTLIVDEATGRKICDATWELGGYLGYNK